MTERHRERLRCSRNPGPRHDYIVDLSAAIPDGTRLWIRYVPDREVLDPASVHAYSGGLPTLALEEQALAVLDDLLNELVPRWIEVRAERADPLPHRVTVEDSQPAWQNPSLLARLPARPPGD
jgi:7-cyano-7-deazaguanine reductase